MTSTAREYFTVNLGLSGLHGVRAALTSQAARDGLTESDVPLHFATQLPATKQTAKLSVRLSYAARIVSVKMPAPPLSRAAPISCA
jgi:hypothetical protein